jgi:chemotaxis protein MotB
LFRNGSARLQPKALKTVDAVGLVLKQFPYQIAIEGFTNRVPMRTRKYPSNWYLSSARALSVLVRFLHDGVRPDLLKAVGFGATHPAVPYVPKHIRDAMRENRRVTIFVEGNTSVIMTQIARMIH